MQCKTVISIMQDYVEARLVQLDRSEFERHVSSCGSCTEELKACRAVFSFLNDMKPERVPVGFQSSVIAELRDRGLVYEPHVSKLKQWYRRFVALPNPVKYPVAVGAAVAALYFPLIAVLGLARGFAGKASVFLTDVFVTVEHALGDVAFLARLFEVVSKDVKGVKTVFNAFVSLKSAFGENIWLLSIGMVAMLTTILIVSLIKIRKRSSHHVLSAY